MSIESEINRIKQNIANAYTYCSEKGGTMPQTQDSANLAATVSSVPSGVDIYDYIEEEPLNDNDGFSGRFLLKKIPEITINENITSLQSAFDDYRYLEEIEGIINNGKGAVTGFLATAMFRDCSALISVPLFNTRRLTGCSAMFQRCTSLTSVPSFDFLSAKNCSYMFSGCTSLSTVPTFNFPNVTNVQNMFQNCTNLSNDSLNNIMATCISAVKISTNKSLAYIGLSSTQATICMGLSNYSSFTAAGWITGY